MGYVIGFVRSLLARDAVRPSQLPIVCHVAQSNMIQSKTNHQTHSNSTYLLQKVKAKVYSIECILSPMHKWDTFSILCSGQKQKHHVCSVFDTGMLSRYQKLGSLS